MARMKGGSGAAGKPLPEPWLRGTLTEVQAVVRGVLHALQLAEEDARRWGAALTPEEVHARPAGLPSVAFQLQHIAGSLDRLLTYAEGGMLSAEQLAALGSEQDAAHSTEALLQAFEAALQRAALRVRALAAEDYEAVRFVGRQRLPTTLGGLLVHLADHTQRHCGQLVTTAKVLLAARGEATSRDSR